MKTIEFHVHVWLKMILSNFTSTILTSYFELSLRCALHHCYVHCKICITRLSRFLLRSSCAWVAPPASSRRSLSSCNSLLRADLCFSTYTKIFFWYYNFALDCSKKLLKWVIRSRSVFWDTKLLRCVPWIWFAFQLPVPLPTHRFWPGVPWSSSGAAQQGPVHLPAYCSANWGRGPS